jgi:RNA polymerase sigma-70 factor, ECF subfamily
MDQEQEDKIKNEMTTAHSDYDKRLNARAYFKTHDQIISGDLVQDTFIKTWNYLRKGGKIYLMKAFLYHVLNGLIIDQYRKRKNISLDILLEKGFELSSNEPERTINISDGKKAILLIQLLPEKYKKLMRMRYIQDLSLKEISLITGQTTNTIAVQVHRGLAKIKLLYNRT